MRLRLRTAPIALARGREFLRHGSNAVAVVLLLILAALATQSRLERPALAVWVLVGASAFFLAVYGTHRFLLHARPASSPFVLRLQRRLHYDHHVEPERLDLLFLPLWFLIPALALYAVVYYALSRNVTITLAIVFGNTSPTSRTYPQARGTYARISDVQKSSTTRELFPS